MEVLKVYCLILTLSQMEIVSSLRCYVCDAADKESCHANGRIQACPSNGGACLTMTYWKKMIAGGEQVIQTAYKKQCIIVPSCQFFCKTRSILKYKDCKVDCCAKDLCNLATFSKRKSTGHCLVGNILTILIPIVAYVA
ncbi:uncharacterized protein LOC130626159 [Hydractinia symbiolongicarpus]|uniref:uncharacterized protein LOC130626159 n=1 Tax=Hydractinia symbiolongicarpus TaxID=13093 RepID=UPI00254B5506|nr:uncharacterized protein LOC130626159 [Hydractinia symbiolongicarpus]